MNAVKIYFCCLCAGIFLGVVPAGAQQNTQITRRDFNSAVLAASTVAGNQIPPEQTGTWQEIINNAVFTIFRTPELYRGEISIRIIEDENVSLRFYPDGVFELSTGLLDFIDETLFVSAASSARRMRQLDNEREKMILPFIAAEAGLFAADAEFSAYSRLASVQGNSTAGKSGSFYDFSERETFLADICAISLLSSSGTFLSYTEWLEYIYTESRSKSILKKYISRFPSYETRIGKLKKEISSPANVVVKLNAVVNSLKTDLGAGEASSFIDDLEEKIPELVYLYRLKALLAHRAWEQSFFKNGENTGVLSMLPFGQTIDQGKTSILKAVIKDVESDGESLFGRLSEKNTADGNERLYKRALDSYRKVSEYYDDFTIRSAYAFLSAQSSPANGLAPIIASAAEAALKEAGTSSIIARTNYARLLFLSGKDLPLAVKMMEEIFPENNYDRVSKKECNYAYVSPGFPGDSRMAAGFYAVTLKQNGNTERAENIVSRLTETWNAGQIHAEELLFKSVGLGDDTDTVASLWGEPSEIAFNTKSETWTYPDLCARIIFMPVPDTNEESGAYEGTISEAVMLKFFFNSPVSLPGEIRTGDSRKDFETVFGFPRYREADAYVYFYNGIRFKVSFSSGSTSTGDEKIRYVSVSF